MGCEGVDWIDLVQHREKCQARMNVVTKPGFRNIQGISGLHGELLVFHK
jgi:hypothetical protein